MEKCLDIEIKNFGPDHSHLSKTYSNLGYVKTEIGDYEGAKADFQKSLDIMNKTIGSDHPSTKATALYYDELLSRMKK